MKFYCLLFCFIVLAPASQKKTEDVTLSVEQRVNLLKRQIAEQIKEKQRTSELLLPINSEHDDYSYVDIEKKPITPIMESDQRKVSDKFKLREISKPPETTTSDSPVILRMRKKRVRSRVTSRNRIVSPFDIFYRRLLMDENKPVQWLHCQDLITPFFSGFREDFSLTKRLTVTDHSVMRLLQLLRLNTTGHTKEEIYSILYQISNLQIRLFQWDVSALTSLLNLLIKDNKAHTFQNLIRGVRSLLSSWHLDFGNTSNLLKQARIFRPPCVRVSTFGGSTKTSRGMRYTKPTTVKSTCAVPGATGCKNEEEEEDED